MAETTLWSPFIITNAGIKIRQESVVEGKPITFNYAKIGQGIPTNPANIPLMLDLISPALQVAIVRSDADGETHHIGIRIDNESLTQSILMTEVGLYASIDGKAPILYGYGYATQGYDSIPPGNVSHYVWTIEIDTVLSRSQNIVFNYDASNIYVTAKDVENGLKELKGQLTDLVDDHKLNKNNPHGITKEQVGLGNVPNVSTNDQKPTYDTATTLAKLVTGEKMGVAFGKIAKAVDELITHLSDSVKHITAEERTTWNGKAAGNHTHTAATQTAAGLMSSDDKKKLDGVAASANNYSLPAATSTARGGVKVGYTANGKNYPVQLSNEQMYVNVPWTDNNTTYSNMKGASASADGTAGLVPAPTKGNQTKYLRADGTWHTPPDTNTTYLAATQSAAGLMSVDDKKKLDGVAENANNYSHPTTAGNKHIPTGGSSNQMLVYSASGTAKWSSTCNAAAIDVVTGNAGSGNNIVIAYKPGRSKALLDAWKIELIDSHYITIHGSTLITEISSNMTALNNKGITTAVETITKYSVGTDGTITISPSASVYYRVIWFN